MSISAGRSRQVLYYGLPILFCLLVHWIAWKIWFYSDDFAWLGLRFEIHSPADIIGVLFRPQAEGTIRTLSERLYFLVFSSLFGLEMLPFRIWTFLTQIANIVLLIQIGRRVTGSAAAGFIAAMLWSANAGLAMALSWSSAYNQIACAFFILLAFHLFLRYIDTGQRKYWVWQWVVFLLGFLALELNVVYPALAAGYAFCCARQHFRKALYLFIPSAIFVAIHLFLIPAPTDPFYKSVYGSSLLVMFWEYWSYAIGALRTEQAGWRPLWLGLLATLAISAVLLVFAVRKLREKQWLPVFLIGWFVIVVLPILPFRNHFTEYYVIVPSVGLAILAGWAIAQSSSAPLRALAFVLVGLYLTVSITDIWMSDSFFYKRSRKMKYLVKGLEAQPESVRQNAILLRDVDNDFFWSGIYDDPFRLIGITRVYVVPGEERNIDQHVEWGGISKFIISLDDAVSLLERHQATVFTLDNRTLRDVTASYTVKAIAARSPDFINVADPMYAMHLGPTWYPAEDGFRWMPESATVKMGGPKSAGQKLHAKGFASALVLAKGPLEISFQADGMPLGRGTVKQEGTFDMEFALPDNLVGKPEIELAMKVNRTTQAPGDSRTFGIVFNTFQIQ